MKSFMYHYVRDDSDDYPFSAHKATYKFLEEIIQLKERGCSFWNPRDVFQGGGASLLEQEDDGKNHIMLTFDDGLKDHLCVAKMLHQIGIQSAAFYIPVAPLIDRAVLAVHKAQYIRSIFGGKSLELLEEVSVKLGIQLIDHNNYERDRSRFFTRYSHRVDDPNTKEFKRIINYYGNLEKRDELLDGILDLVGIEMKFSDVYLSPEDIVEISSLGFEIGSHGVSHTPMSRLEPAVQEEELILSKLFLERLLSREVHSFCYPYGGKSSYDEDTIRLLQQAGYKNAISVESRDITLEDMHFRPYELPRFDCNEISGQLDALLGKSEA